VPQRGPAAGRVLELEIETGLVAFPRGGGGRGPYDGATDEHSIRFRDRRLRLQLEAAAGEWWIEQHESARPEACCGRCRERCHGC
jgi:hypothetical protein